MTRLYDVAEVHTVDAENPNVGDIRLVNGDSVFITDLGEAVAQHLRQRFNFFKGTWFLNLNEGIPYFEQVLVKNPDLSSIRSLFRRVIQETPGVARVNFVKLDFRRQERVLQVEGECVLDNGKVFSLADFGPFLVEV